MVQPEEKIQRTFSLVKDKAKATVGDKENWSTERNSRLKESVSSVKVPNTLSPTVPRRRPA